MKKNNMIKLTKKKETMKKIRSKKSNLLNYFIVDHKNLSKNYLKSCNQFFKSDLFKSNDLKGVKKLSW
jgi:ribosomal protein L10